MTRLHALVLTGFGLNCDHETAYALELAGATAVRGHINALIEGEVNLADFQILAFGGGFSWGDDHGAGVIQAVRMRTNLGRQLLDFVAADKLIIGICNGFQTLVNLGLLPAIDGDYEARRVALTYNDCGNFRNQWVHLHVDQASACLFTRGLHQLELPVRHGEGKFWAPRETLTQLEANQQIVLRYAGPDGHPAQGIFPANPNGSLMDIAGICDPSGRIFGLMPHPEAYNHWTNHPDWSLHKSLGWTPPEDVTPGIQIFRNAVQAFN
ncbi:MAG: phosphoribosylformylglycinamidine synthase subunit PurQ [Desulfosarcinaceae bacterium]|nr:phosphoribosylformylglycinamidine synthase subunit PurQ [Desulfosarcinaceae bacterium]